MSPASRLCRLPAPPPSGASSTAAAAAVDVVHWDSTVPAAVPWRAASSAAGGAVGRAAVHRPHDRAVVLPYWAAVGGGGVGVDGGGDVVVAAGDDAAGQSPSPGCRAVGAVRRRPPSPCSRWWLRDSRSWSPCNRLSSPCSRWALPQRRGADPDGDGDAGRPAGNDCGPHVRTVAAARSCDHDVVVVVEPDRSL